MKRAHWFHQPPTATGIDPDTHQALLSYRRAAELLEDHAAALADGPYTLHQLRHSLLTPAPRTARPTRC